MSEEQLQQLRGMLQAGKVKPEFVSTEYAFQRAWNEGIAFAERQIDKIATQQAEDGT